MTVLSQKILILLLTIISLPATAQEWRFNVTLDGKPFGNHTFKLSTDGAQKTLISEANFKYKILGITAYRYTHKAEERWQQDCLQGLTASTNDNGDEKKVAGQQTDGVFALTGPKKTPPLGNCIMTFAYWNPKLLSQTQLLNPQTGDYLDSKIKFIGDENLVVRGASVPVKHHVIETIKFKIDLWYDNNGEWVALQSTTPDGHKVAYSLQ